MEVLGWCLEAWLVAGGCRLRILFCERLVFAGFLESVRAERGDGLSAFGFARGGKDFLGCGGLNCKVKSWRLGWGLLVF